VCNKNVSEIWGKRLYDGGILQAQSCILHEMAVRTIVEAELLMLVVSEKPETKQIFFKIVPYTSFPYSFR
jgi:hypothetical protein